MMFQEGMGGPRGSEPVTVVGLWTWKAYERSSGPPLYGIQDSHSDLRDKRPLVAQLVGSCLVLSLRGIFCCWLELSGPQLSQSWSVFRNPRGVSELTLRSPLGCSSIPHLGPVT